MEIRYNERLDDCMNKLTMDVITSGYVHTGPEWQGKALNSPFSRLYLVESGSGWMESGDQKILMEPGKTYLIPPGTLLNFGCPREMTKLYFHINLLKPNRYDLLQPLGKICVMDTPSGWLEAMKQLQNSTTLFDALLLKQYLLQFLAMFAQQEPLPPENITVFSPHVGQCINYIQHKLTAKLSVAELAQHCYLSQRQLNNLFRKELGVTPGQYLDDQLMLAAQRRLIQTTDSIGSISEALGFADQFYFSRKFKKSFGLTPLQYRKKHRA